jgi:hypothetical protein
MLTINNIPVKISKYPWLRAFSPQNPRAPWLIDEMDLQKSEVTPQFHQILLIDNILGRLQ